MTELTPTPELLLDGEAIDPDAAAVRKATWRIIPILGAGYAVALMDRTNLGFASLQMNRDLHLSATVYGFGAGIFFLSYGASNVPANLVLLRLGARRWLAAMMLVWGLASAATMFVRSPTSFYLLRLFLGVAEAGFFPGVIYYLASWFPAHLRARAITRFYVAGPLSSMCTSGVASSLLKLQGTLGLAGWQWLFLIEALPAVALSAVICRWLPDSPAAARWLTPAESGSLSARINREHAQIRNGPPAGILAALRDPRVWSAGACMFSVLWCYYVYVFFAPAFIQRQTGWTTGRVGLLMAGQFLIGGIAMVVAGINSDRTRDRRLHIAGACLTMGVGFAIATFARAPGLVVGGLMLVPIFQSASQGPFWAACSAFLAGRSAAAGIGAITALSIFGGFVGPYFIGWSIDHTGGLRLGFATCAVLCAVSAALARHFALPRVPSPAPPAAARPAPSTT